MTEKIEVEDLWNVYVTQSLPHINKAGVQYIESRRVFYAAVGMTLITLRDVLGSENITEEDGTIVLEDMMQQILKAYEKAAAEQESKKPEENKSEPDKEFLAPRFRGNAIPIGSAWGWEAFITLGRSDSKPIELQSKQTFISKDAAIVDLRDNSVKILKTICEEAHAPVPTHFHDLNEGTFKPMKSFEKESRH
jgi:hypothetical protein